MEGAPVDSDSSGDLCVLLCSVQYDNDIEYEFRLSYKFSTKIKNMLYFSQDALKHILKDVDAHENLWRVPPTRGLHSPGTHTQNFCQLGWRRGLLCR